MLKPGPPLLTAVYQKMGIDGIIMDASASAFGAHMEMESDTTRYIVWEPGQIKSALGNSGACDREVTSIVAIFTPGEKQLLLRSAAMVTARPTEQKIKLLREQVELSEEQIASDSHSHNSARCNRKSVSSSDRSGQQTNVISVYPLSK